MRGLPQLQGALRRPQRNRRVPKFGHHQRVRHGFDEEQACRRRVLYLRATHGERAERARTQAPGEGDLGLTDGIADGIDGLSTRQRLRQPDRASRGRILVCASGASLRGLPRNSLAGLVQRCSTHICACSSSAPHMWAHTDQQPLSGCGRQGHSASVQLALQLRPTRTKWHKRTGWQRN